MKRKNKPIINYVKLFERTSKIGLSKVFQLFTVVILFFLMSVQGASTATLTTIANGNWNATGVWPTTNRTGTISASTGSTTVTGTNTTFLSDVGVGTIISTQGGTAIGTVASVQSNTSLTLTANSSNSVTSQTWRTNATPGPGDAIIIVNSVTANISASCASLQVGSGGTNGTLTFGAGSTITFNVLGNVNIANSGSKITSGTGGGNSHIFNIDGNISCTGTWDMWGKGTTDDINVVLTGTTQTISGTGTFGWNTLTVNSGSTATVTTTSAQTINADLTISGVLDFGTTTFNRATSGGTLTVTGIMILGGTTGGQTGSNFPLRFNTVNIATGTVVYDYSGAQTIYATPTYYNLTLAQSGSKNTTGAKVNNILSMEGTATASAPISYGPSATIQYKGTGNFTTSVNEFPNGFSGTGGVIIDQGSGNTVTLTATKTAIAGDLNIKSGIFDLTTFTINRNSVGGILTISNGATLKIGGTNTFPSNYSTHTIGCTSTTEYSGTTQTVAVLNAPAVYGNLTLSGSGAKTLQIGMTSICNNLTISGTATTTGVVGLTIGGSVNIGLGTTLTAGAFTHYVAGNWTRNGSFTATGSTINFNGTSNQNIGASNFNNLTLSGSGTISATGSLAIVGNLTISSNFTAGSFTHTLQGNIFNNGVFTTGTSTVTLTGVNPQTIGGNNSTTFYNLIKNGNGVANLGINTTVSNTLSLILGNIDLGNYYLTISPGGTISGGSKSSYLKTSGTGRLKQQVASLANKVFPIGNSTFNQMTLTNNGSNATDNFNIRVDDLPITNADSTKTIRHRWFMTKDQTGTASLTMTAKYNMNTGEEGTNFDKTNNPQFGFFNGTNWAYRTATVNSDTSFTATGDAPDFTNETGYFILGSSNVFNATKLAVSKITPTNPSLGTTNSIITVQAQNSFNTPTIVMTSTGISLSASNTTISPSSPTGTIAQYSYETQVTSITFTESTFNTQNQSYDHDATVTATRTSGESLTSGTSSTFDVLLGTIWEPVATENWDATNGWKKSTDGGTTWINPATLPTSNIFSETDVIRIPSGITLSANVNASFYSMLVYGTIDITSNTLTLNHPTDNISGYEIHVHGTLKNSGGYLRNTNINYPIEIHGGTYWHARDGDSIPIATWYSLGTTKSTCKVTGITSTALSGGLIQTFQDFEWANSSQGSTVQNLNGDLNITGNLTLTAGIITTTSNHVIEAALGSIFRTNGWVNGNFRIYIPNISSPSILFPIGDANYYTPINISFSGTVSGSGYLDAYTTSGIGAPPLSSGLSTTKYVNRKWTIVNNGVTGFTSFSPTFSWNSNDQVGSPTTTNLHLRKFNNNIWYTTNGSTSTDYQITASGLTAFSDFYVAEDNCTSSNYIWLGSINTDWNIAGNWCSGVIPTSTTDVTIPGGIVNYPVIGATGGNCKNLTIVSGASLTISGSNSLNIYGNLSNSGTFATNTSTISFLGSTAQTITGTTVFNNLTINNTAGVTASNNITVNGILALTSVNPDANHGTLDMGSNTLSMLSASASVTGTGDVSGIVKRTHTFSPNIHYSFGSQYTTLTFLGNGTQPNEIMCKITIGSSPNWKNSAINRFYSFAQTGTTGTDKTVLNLHYLDAELNSNDETKLVFWDHHSNGEIDEHGKSNNNTINNWVGLTNLSINYIAPTVLDNKTWALANYTTIKNIWIGATNTDWNIAENWTAGHSPYTTDDVLIPTSPSGGRFPALTSNVEIKTLEIESGATVTAGSYNITINGSTGAWINNGTFYPGTGTVYFTKGDLTKIVTIAGTTQFNDINIAANTYIRPGSGTYIRISGQVVGDPSSVVDLTSPNNTVEYNGSTSQSVLSPITDGFPEKGYYNLVLSGSGSKTILNDLFITGDLTTDAIISVGSNSINFIGTFSKQAINGTIIPTFNDMYISNIYGVSASEDITLTGILYLQTPNPDSTHGTLDMGTNILKITIDTAGVAGSGEVTGIIKREHTFQANTFYSFGNKNQGVIFPNYSGQILPNIIEVKVSIGVTPVWTPSTPGNILKRQYDIAQSGGSGTSALFRINYQDSEMSSEINESTLSIWSNSNNSTIDNGWSNYNVNDNYITISDVDIGMFPNILGGFLVGIAPTSTTFLTWNGSTSTDWNTPQNWTPSTVPVSTLGVVIPDANTTPYQPTLPIFGQTQANCHYILIETGGILNSGLTDNASITITNNGVVSDAWATEPGGTFNAGNSTVTFINNGTDVGSIDGNTDFYNITISSGSKIRPAVNSYIGISGVLTITGILGAATNENTIEFKGTDQLIPNPNGSTPGYHNLILSGSGTKTIPLTLQIFDEFTNNTTGNIDFTTNSSTVIFDGNAYNQVINGITPTVFNNLTLNNSFGLTIENNETVSGTLTFTSGIISTNSNILTLGSGSSCSSGTVSGAGTGKYVNGNLSIYIPNSTNSITFDIGDATNYTPLSLTFTGSTSGCGYLTAFTSKLTSPPDLLSNLNQTKYLARKWSITNNGVGGFTSYNSTFTFVTDDIVGSANPSYFVIKKFDSSIWSTPSTGIKTNTSTQALGLNSFNEFYIGEVNITKIPTNKNIISK